MVHTPNSVVDARCLSQRVWTSGAHPRQGGKFQCPPASPAPAADATTALKSQVPYIGLHNEISDERFLPLCPKPLSIKTHWE